MNIIEFLENKNQLTRLTDNYENRLINKIKDNFKDSEQQIFLTYFYSFLKYDTKKDFVIDLDNVWKWLGFLRKDQAKTVLKKHFIKDIDYKVKNNFPSDGGIFFVKSVETILLTVNTFKKFCLKAKTKNSDKIHEYYIKLTELLYETVNEESQELKKILNAKNEIEKIKCTKKPKQDYTKLKNVIYIITTDEFELNREYIIGKAVDLNNYIDFKLIYYISCNSQVVMDYMECLILSKLNEYKYENNFRLPDGCDINIFTNVFDVCSKLFEDVNEEDIIYPTYTDNFNILVNDKLCNEIFNSRKDSVVCYIKKHFIENENYVITYPNKNININGGQNKKDYKMTSESFDLLKNSYKLRQIELSKKNITHPILIYIETATIGFISEIFKDFNIKKQYRVDKYLIDLYFIDYKIAVECDEDHHKHNIKKDKEREEIIKKQLNCSFIRYTPNIDNIQIVINKIMNLITIPKLK
jgi:very-short-patch-repair endonuclease